MFSFGSAFYDERPMIYFDSHPEPPAGLVWNALSHVKNQLYIAWTGDVVLDVQPGLLRLQWWTVRNPQAPSKAPSTNGLQDEGKFGKRDYEIREFEEVRLGFEQLCNIPEVARCQVLGYPSQNPFSVYGESPYALNERKKREILASPEYQSWGSKSKKDGVSVGQKIDAIIGSEDKKQELKKQQFGGTEEA